MTNSRKVGRLARRSAPERLGGLQEGADALSGTGGGELCSPLRVCVEHGQREMAAMLLRCGATQTVDDAGGLSGMTALGRAASRLDIPMLELLLKAGADPMALDADRRTAQERLPPREPANQEAWDSAAALLAGRSHG